MSSNKNGSSWTNSRGESYSSHGKNSQGCASSLLRLCSFFFVSLSSSNTYNGGGSNYHYSNSDGSYYYKVGLAGLFAHLLICSELERLHVPQRRSGQCVLQPQRQVTANEVWAAGQKNVAPKASSHAQYSATPSNGSRAPAMAGAEASLGLPGV